MDSRLAKETSIPDLFDRFIDASNMSNALLIHRRILECADLTPCEFNIFFPKLKKAVMASRTRKNWKAKALFSKIDKKAAHRCYSNTKTSTPLGSRNYNSYKNSQQPQSLDESSISSQSSRVFNDNNALQSYNCLIIGSGPAGLRTAIELQLLGASRVVVVEKRSRFSRNNVLHLWPFVIDDLKSLGAKKFYGKFCAGSIDHISIRQLQMILLKICLMIGCDFRESCSYLYLCPTSLAEDSIKESDNTEPKSLHTNSERVVTQCEFINSPFDFIQNKSINASDVIQSEASPQVTTGGDSKEVFSSTQQSADSDANLEKKTDDKIYDDNLVTRKTLTESMTSTLGVRPDSSSSWTRENLRGTRAHFESEYKDQEKELHSYEWDIVIGADGRQNTLSKFFSRKEFRGRLAIAITANFLNKQTPAEASIPEISGISYIYNQDMFNALAYDTNIELENICYYKDDTHYFVMTAKKKSLLERGVLLDDCAATHDLLSEKNIDRQALLKYAKDAAYWTTGLQPLEFALNHYGQEDCAMFDFTSMYAASSACKALRTREGGLALIALVGDSLLEPFWPTGSGCARGFLSSFDAAWMCRQWAVNKCAVLDYHSSPSKSSRYKSPANSDLSTEPSIYNRMALSVMAERESIYRLLAQTKSENLQQNYSHWTLNPHSRYPNLNRHLVTPSQIEHLISDHNKRSSPVGKPKARTERCRPVKSPNLRSISRKSPKKLKSADASPLAQRRSPRNRSRPTSKYSQLSRSKCDIDLDSTYLDFENSYNNLAENNGRIGRPNCDILDDFFVPSISGTMPSSKNLLSLEARRSRDIDDCLRQRRQKTKISFVRDELVRRLRSTSVSLGEFDGETQRQESPGRIAFFQELKRLKDQKNTRRESKPNESSNPLSLLCSMRRCASFAERIKSFENRLGLIDRDSPVPVTPKTPIDNVKNLPQYSTLKELLAANSINGLNEEPKKSKMPIMKLTKDDWNVKCWEKRLAAHKERSNLLTGSLRNLSKTSSVDSYHTRYSEKSSKTVDVFQDRIKEMSKKLDNMKPDSNRNTSIKPHEPSRKTYSSGITSRLGSSRPQGNWINHLKGELTRGGEFKRNQSLQRQPMNPNIPSKPIKKLFEDDDPDDDKDDKHCDHLCIIRPTNKYLSRSRYTSHLVRTKYNSETSKVVNRPQPTSANSRAFIEDTASPGLDANNEAKISSLLMTIKPNQYQEEVKCFRCLKKVESIDRITIGYATLHKICLACAQCGITLRTNEIQLYLDILKKSGSSDASDTEIFVCSICNPEIRAKLNANFKTATLTSRGSSQKSDTSDSILNEDENIDPVQVRLKSREDFLNSRINYNELYKNLMDDNVACTNEINNSLGRLGSSSRETTPATSGAQTSQESDSSHDKYEDSRSNLETSDSSESSDCESESESPSQSEEPSSRSSSVDRTHELSQATTTSDH